MKTLIRFSLCLLWISFAVCSCHDLRASTLIRGLVTITNTPANNDTLTINAIVRTWKTQPVATPSTQIAITNSIGGNATNLFSYLATYPLSRLQMSRSSTNGVAWLAFENEALTITASGTWATITYLTNTVSDLTVIRVPFSNIPDTAATNRIYQATEIVRGLNSYSSLALDQTAPAASELVGLANNQTIAGAKTITGYTLLSGNVVTFTNNTSVNFSGTAIVYVNTNASVKVMQGSAFTINTNAVFTFIDGTTVTGTKTGTGSTNWNFNYTPSQDTVMRRKDGTNQLTAFAANTNTFGGIIVSNLTALAGLLDNVTISNATAYNLISANDASFSGLFRLPRTDISSLANGNNSDLDFGAGAYIRIVAGPTAAFTIAGILPSATNNGRVLIIENATSQNMTIANQSGVDPTPANRIDTLTGANVTTIGNEIVILIYDSAASRWKLVSSGGVMLADGVGTINATDGYIPYRQNSTTFADSPFYFISTNRFGFNSTNSSLFFSPFDVGIGLNALSNQVTLANANTAVGVESLLNATTAINNEAFGYRSLKSLTAGSANAAFGLNALVSLSTGTANAGFGDSVLFATLGDNNTAAGYHAGFSNTTGKANVLVGYLANPSGVSKTNEVVIGANAVGNGNNTITLGDTNVTQLYLGHVLIGSTAGGTYNFGNQFTVSAGSNVNFSIGLRTTNQIFDGQLSAPVRDVPGVNIDASTGTEFTKILPGNTTMGILNMTNGQTIHFTVTNTTFTLGFTNTLFSWNSGVTPVIDTNAVNMFHFTQLGGWIFASDPEQKANANLAGLSSMPGTGAVVKTNSTGWTAYPKLPIIYGGTGTNSLRTVGNGNIPFHDPTNDLLDNDDGQFSYDKAGHRLLLSRTTPTGLSQLKMYEGGLQPWLDVSSASGITMLDTNRTTVFGAPFRIHIGLGAEDLFYDGPGPQLNIGGTNTMLWDDRSSELDLIRTTATGLPLMKLYDGSGTPALLQLYGNGLNVLNTDMVLGVAVGHQMSFQVNSVTDLKITGNDSVVIGDGTTTASRTNKFLYLPITSDIPTGVPAVENAGTVPAAYNTNTHHLNVYAGGWKRVNGMLYENKGAAQLTNTTVETSLFPASFNGSKTLDANYLVSGKQIRINLRGLIAVTNSPTLEIKLKAGSTILADTGVVTMINTSTLRGFDIDVWLTCASTGATGAVYANGTCNAKSSSTATTRFDFPDSALQTSTTNTVDTTATQALDVTAQWSAASINNDIRIYQATIVSQ